MGERFGKFVLERKLAVGGMAEIFLATHQGPEGFKKHVAIKRILPHLTEDTDFVTMFLDEARLVARFNHPNIVQIFELGEVDRRFFLAMEYVHGISMSKLLKACRKKDIPLPLEYGAKIVSFACEGLDYAHSFADADGTPLNLIHRDISPQNLMVSYDGVVKVLDFGIAKATGNVYQTRTSSLKGKAAYMSPEQITAKGGLDRRSDIFSLGIVLFEVAAGQRPFSGDTELELMMAIVKQAAPDPRQFDETIPADLSAIISRALAKDREQRYQSCRELRQELEEFLLNRRMLVDNYTLGAFAREVIPPGDSVVGYSVPTPSGPSAAGQDRAATTPSRARARTPTGQRKPIPDRATDDAPTQMTPSSQLRPLLELAESTESPTRGETPAGRSAPSRPKPEGGHRKLVIGLVLVVLVAAIGAGAAFLVFEGQKPEAPVGDTGAGSGIDAGSPGEPTPVDGAIVASGHSDPVDAGLPPASETQAGDPDRVAAAPEAPAPDSPAVEKPIKRRRKRSNHKRRRRVASKPADPVRPPAPDAGTPVAKIQPPGKLKVDSRPWTNVAIDGVSYGTTPLGPVELKPGVHKVVLTNKAKGIRLAKTIRILPGQSQRVQEKFGQGMLQVFVKPFGEVFVNGISKGITPLGGPIKLFEGQHTVKVVCSRTGKQDNKRVMISAGQTQKLIFDLR